MKSLSRKKFIQLIVSLWFKWPFSGWKHPYYVDYKWYRVYMPNSHWNKDIPWPLVKAILKQIGADIDEKYIQNL